MKKNKRRIQASALLVCLILLLSCSPDFSVTKLSLENENLYVKQCVINWQYDYYQINDVIHALENIKGEVSDFILLKSGAASGGAYSFTALARVKDDKGILLFMDTPSLEIITVSISVDLVNDFIDRYHNLVGNEDKLIEGQIHNVSHVPCEFFISRSGDTTKRMYIIGIVDESRFEDFIVSIRLLEDKFSRSPKSVSPLALPFPPEDELNKLRVRMGKDLFFEIEKWKELKQEKSNKCRIKEIE